MMDTKVVPGSSEIIEIEALIPGKHHRGGSFMEPELKREEENRRSLASNAGKIASLEEDLNQLFEIFNSRTSSIRHSHENQATTSKRNSSKMHVKSRSSNSSAHEISERVNLKQALRGLCISQASELASMKRSMKSPRSSEAERIMSMYRSVVEDSNPEKSLGPERRVSDPFPRTPKKSPSLDLWPSKRNSLADKAVGLTPTTMHNEAVKLPAEKVVVAAAVEAGQRKSKVDMIYQDRKSQSPCYSDDSHDKGLSTETLHDKKYDDPPCSSRSSYGKTSLNPARKMAEKEKRISASPKEEHPRARSLSTSDLGEKFSDLSEDSVEVVGKEAKVASKKAEKSRLARNAQHFAKPPIRSKNLVKSGSKKNQSLDNCSKNTRDEFDNDQYSSPNPIVCPRCQCVVTDAWKEPSIDSSVSNQHSPASQESVVFYEDSPMSPCASISGTSSDGLDKSKTIFVESTSHSRSRDKMEFTRSSEGSPGEYSSNTTVSQESTLSRPSFCDRPHMSKDVRWEAICLVRSQHGALGLKNFSLLKKLGCGDIGTVYLTELIGTNCLFAVKVMDNEFLARRKKITRAQTEKEILRMLDHPFLPTLYSKFTSDNLSCLVMEYCPGGDLHVLRQKQVGKCFTEQAARFYVAEVLLALEYLHMLGVIYRDLKPENILVREDGHIMLSDFDLSLRCAVSPALMVSSSTSEGSKNTTAPRDSHSCSDSRCAATCQVTCFTSKHSRKPKTNAGAEMRPLLQLVAEPTTARSNSFVGTHEYLAPEIIKGEGHGSAVDWWTFGIFLYELLYGRTPFKGADNEETLANVVLQSLKFPDCPLVSLQARELIAALLVKEPEHRLGTERGATDIKQHPFFEGLNWALIRCAVPPELPEPQQTNAVSSETTVNNAEELEFGVF